jgi:hypothetical protein
MVGNYIGLCKCIEDDFKYFCDVKYLELKKCPPMKSILGDNQNDDEFWIYNTYYNFAFNHESPGHGKLYLHEHWPNGINHFVENNFEKFIERYNTRIENFRYYIKNCKKINFIIARYNSLPVELLDILNKKYLSLDFEIITLLNISNGTIDGTRNKTLNNAIDFELSYLKYLNIDKEKYPQEYNRYFTPLQNFNNIEKCKIMYFR